MRPLPWAVGIRPRLMNLRPPVLPREIGLPDDAEAQVLQPLLECSNVRFRKALAVHVRQRRALGSLDGLVNRAIRSTLERVGGEEMTEGDSSLQGEIGLSRDVMSAPEADRDRGVDRFESQEHAGDRAGRREVRPLCFRAPLFDVERRRRQIRTVMRRLERHVVWEPLASFRSPRKAAVIQRGADGTSVSGCPPNSAPRGLPIGWTVRLGRRLSETCFDRYTTTSARCPKAASRSRSRWSR